MSAPTDADHLRRTLELLGAPGCWVSRGLACQYFGEAIERDGRGHRDQRWEPVIAQGLREGWLERKPGLLRLVVEDEP